jgi:Tfp pilus assembly major pilin PilA
MSRSVTSGQRGFSLIGFLFVGGVLAVTGVVVAQIIPTAIEYQAVLKAAQKATDGNTVVEVRNIFDKAAAIDNISSVSGKDIEVTKENDKVVVSFAYQREIHLAGPAYLTMKYAGKSK